MKLLCTVSVGNRQQSNLPVRSTLKHVKSTLALCKRPKSEDDYCIIHFTAQNKTGTKYTVRGNISQILTRFLNEGKATVQFKTPPHDLLVKSDDVIQLKGFLHLLKRVLENKVGPREAITCSMSATAIGGAKEVAPKKLVIRSRSEYPSKGFPRTLEVLQINGVKRCALDQGILRLNKLKVLDLSDNWIEFIPEELNQLPCLSELNLASNHLHKATGAQWKWMGGNLSKTLVSLNLEANTLKYLPDQLVKLHNLIFLNVKNNELLCLPPGIGNLRQLRNLVASNNKLTTLPGSISKCRLQDIDLFNNNFDTHRHNNEGIKLKALPICSLKEYAARSVLTHKLPYSPETVPSCLAHYLDHAKYCVCGKPCLENFIHTPEVIILANIALNYVTGSNQSPYFPVDCYFCSLTCFRKSHHSSRNRYPVI